MISRRPRGSAGAFSAVAATCLAALLSTAGVAAQVPASQFFDGPPAPIEPAVISRDEWGRVTVRAVRLTSPLRVDGRLDEAVYGETPSMSDFIQSAPIEGEKATEVTEVWVFYDEDNVYVSVRCHESDPSRIVASEMRRDNTSVFAGSDAVGFIFDNPVRLLLEAAIEDLGEIEDISGEVDFLDLTPVNAPELDQDIGFEPEVLVNRSGIRGVAVTATARNAVDAFTLGLTAAGVAGGSGSVTALLDAGDTKAYIDDDASVRELLQRHLVKDGYDVRLAADGKTGLALARELRPAAIVLDVMMPAMDGWSVLAELRKDQTLQDTPVIIASMVDNHEMGLALGADEVEERREVIAHDHQIRARARDRRARAGMPEDVQRVGRMIGRRALDDGDPVPEQRAGGPVDHGLTEIEHQVAHVGDVGALEGDDRVTARVRRPVVPRADRLVADLLAPVVRERGVRIELIAGRRLASRRLLHVPRRVLVRDDLLRHALEDDVAAGVIAMMMRVDQPIDASSLRALVEAVEEQLRGVRKLRVDDDHAVRIDEIADRAAAGREVADVAANRCEHRRWRLSLPALPSEQR